MNVLQSLAALLMAMVMPVSAVTETAETPAQEETVVLAAETSEAIMESSPSVLPQNPTQETVPETTESTSPWEDWNLLLVNRQHLIPEGYTCNKATLSNGLQVDERIYADLTQMLNDCKQAGLHPVVCSAYRSESKQTYLYQNKVARLRYAGYSQEDAEQEAMRWVAIPGTSEHQTGMAVDIVAASYQLLDQQQENTAEQKWLMEHCWEYGFILRYPSEKSDITGIGYEPWHYRYVGKEAALAMRESGECLEEYITSLQAAAVQAAAVQAPAPIAETAMDITRKGIHF